MGYIAELDAPVLGFEVNGSTIDCLCLNRLARIQDGKIINAVQVFEKDGLSRIFRENSKYITVSDFCTLSIFSKEDFSLIKSLKLGSDLSSDICGLLIDENYAYCCIRNGRITKVSFADFSCAEYPVSGASLWELCDIDRYLLGGTVDGHLLLICKDDMSITGDIALSRQNLKNIAVHDGIAYAASQDKKLYLVDLDIFELIKTKRNLHGKAFYIVGFHNGQLITVSYPSSEFSFWDMESLENVNTVKEPLKLSGCARLDKGRIIYSSRNINGIKYMDIQ